jgi:DNA mismatch repair protein MutS
LAAIYQDQNRFGLSFLDISTGEFFLAESGAEGTDKWLQNFAPKEILVSKNQRKAFTERFGPAHHTFFMEDWIFQETYARETLTGHFDTSGLKGFGIDNMPLGIIAAAAVLHYLGETQHRQLGHLRNLSRLSNEDYVWMDRFTIQNLELFQARESAGVSLIEIIDKTRSPMGGRMLRRWLALPLIDLKAIQKRHEAVAHFVNHPEQRTRIQDQLRRMGDLERLIAKVAAGKVCPREVVQLKNALEAIIPIKGLIENSKATAVRELADNLDTCDSLRNRIKSVLSEDAPAIIGKGITVAEGYSEELDELRGLSLSGKDYLEQMLQRESERTGIPSLKIASNNVFGYYIEVRNTHKDKVPPEWIRKQTLVNAERYITEELKTYEGKILGAEERILALEQQLFGELVTEMQSYIDPVQKNAQKLAALDCLSGFADLAVGHNYVAPEMTEDTDLQIMQGRHPVIERKLAAGEWYIPNDLLLDRENQQIIMITGPNMSGKSAILRQTALVVLLAQIGSFVPASSAKLGLIDKIFTRVGASDNISLGESTFMVEMNEAASILNNLSERSLILLDEIGRGTSTYDGISIAWAIAEYLHEHPSRPKTLFATHYHELNEMAVTFPRIQNYNVAVKELKDKVLFLRKLEPGGSEHSFGIHVAKMAGMPDQVIRKANQLLKKLEKSHSAEALDDKLKNVEDDLQLSFFNLDDPLLEQIRDEILDLNIDNLTPVEALMKLNEIKRLLSGKNG